MELSPLQEMPTYHVTRHPHHWGVALESCWAVLSSFPPPRTTAQASQEEDVGVQWLFNNAIGSALSDSHRLGGLAQGVVPFLRIHVTEQMQEIRAFNAGEPLDGLDLRTSCRLGGGGGGDKIDQMDERVASLHAHEVSTELMRVGDDLS